MQDKVWVIIRSTGEYSDRHEECIRFCLSEEEAQETINQTEIQKQRDKIPEYPTPANTYAWHRPDGSILTNDELPVWSLEKKEEIKYLPLPNIEELDALYEKQVEKYNEEIKALNHVDPDGCNPDSYYYYQVCTLWPS